MPGLLILRWCDEEEKMLWCWVVVARSRASTVVFSLPLSDWLRERGAGPGVSGQENQGRSSGLWLELWFSAQLLQGHPTPPSSLDLLSVLLLLMVTIWLTGEVMPWLYQRMIQLYLQSLISIHSSPGPSYLRDPLVEMPCLDYLSVFSLIPW